MSFGNKEDILLASNLAYNFTSTFKRDIGLKFCGAVGSLPCFGRVIMVAVNISFGNEAVDIAASKTLFKYGDYSVWSI